VRRAERKSRAKFVNIVHVTHRDEVEPPITDWLREAYELPRPLKARGATAMLVRERRPSAPAKSVVKRTRRAGHGKR
jgi:hypothetical protein